MDDDLMKRLLAIGRQLNAEPKMKGAYEKVRKIARLRQALHEEAMKGLAKAVGFADLTDTTLEALAEDLIKAMTEEFDEEETEEAELDGGAEDTIPFAAFSHEEFEASTDPIIVQIREALRKSRKGPQSGPGGAVSG